MPRNVRAKSPHGTEPVVAKTAAAPVITPTAVADRNGARVTTSHLKTLVAMEISGATAAASVPSSGTVTPQ